MLGTVAKEIEVTLSTPHSFEDYKLLEIEVFGGPLGRLPLHAAAANRASLVVTGDIRSMA